MRFLPILLGAVLIVFCIISIVGLQAKEPREVTIEDLYEGKFDDGEYVKVVDGVSTYYNCAYTFMGDSEKFESFCHPIYTKIDPDVQESVVIAKKCNSANDFPEAEWKRSVEFKVLVETSEYDCNGDLPDGPRENKIIGTVSKTAGSLDSKMKKLMEEAYKDADCDKTVLIREGSHPPMPLSILGIVLGVVLIIVGIMLVVSKGSQARRVVYQQNQQAYGSAQQPGVNQQFPQRPYGSAPQPGMNPTPPTPPSQYPQPPAQDSQQPPANDDSKFPPLRDEDDDFFDR